MDLPSYKIRWIFPVRFLWKFTRPGRFRDSHGKSWEDYGISWEDHGNMSWKIMGRSWESNAAPYPGDIRPDLPMICEDRSATSTDFEDLQKKGKKRELLCWFSWIFLTDGHKNTYKKTKNWFPIIANQPDSLQKMDQILCWWISRYSQPETKRLVRISFYPSSRLTYPLVN